MTGEVGGGQISESLILLFIKCQLRMSYSFLIFSLLNNFHSFKHFGSESRNPVPPFFLIRKEIRLQGSRPPGFILRLQASRVHLSWRNCEKLEVSPCWCFFFPSDNLWFRESEIRRFLLENMTFLVKKMKTC